MSGETIYQAVYVHLHGELKREFARSLRRGRSARKAQRNPDARSGRFVDPMTPLTERPAEVESRAVPGHWEGDLIVGAGSRLVALTIVERSTQYVVLGHLPVERTAEAVRDSLIAAFSGVPSSLRRTLTWDQGAEMSEHRSVAMSTNMKAYFCDPASPWQRGTNENTNGLPTPILTPAQRPQSAKPRRTHRHRKRTQRATPENPQLGHSRRTNV